MRVPELDDSANLSRNGIGIVAIPVIAIDLTNGEGGAEAPFDPGEATEGALRLIAARLASAHARRVAPATASVGPAGRVGPVGMVGKVGARRETIMVKV